MSPSEPPPSAIIPSPIVASSADRQHERLWGFSDSGFAVESGHVVLESPRYDNAGRPLPGFLPFVEKAIGVPFDPEDRHEPHAVAFPEGPDMSHLVARLHELLPSDAISTEPAQRLRRGHGHHLEEIFSLLYGKLERMPDVVVFPGTDGEIQAVLHVAKEFGALVLPYGGGTSVTRALSCPSGDSPIISLDLGRMDQVRWIDPMSRTACIEAGAVGRLIEECLQRYGFTLGHEPDSVEFSTLGGWIATNASGMKKNRYGNIESIVLDVTVVSSSGVVEHPVRVPRASHGLDVRRLVLGSEGLLGIITRAVVKIHRMPEVKRYASFVFPDFSRGLAFLRELSEWQALPASVRLVDNLQFQFGQALKPPSGRLKSAMQKLLLTAIKGISLKELVACTLVFEGHAEEQAQLEARVSQLAKRYRGVSGGGSAGKAGYNLTFGIAYIRDFLLQYWTIGDSFETSAPWDCVEKVISRVKEAIANVHKEQSLPGHPFVTARVSQIYQTGCCIYFYIGFYYKGVADPLAAFRELEYAARVAILEAGGALSHHHGVGQLWAPFLPRIKSAAALSWERSARRALDPDGVFASRNQLPSGPAD